VKFPLEIKTSKTFTKLYWKESSQSIYESIDISSQTDKLKSFPTDELSNVFCQGTYP